MHSTEVMSKNVADIFEKIANSRADGGIWWQIGGRVARKRAGASQLFLNVQNHLLPFVKMESRLFPYSTPI